MKLIDADVLEKAIYEWMPKDQSTWMDSDLPPIENLVISIMMTIQEQPIVNAAPIEHGHWIFNPKDAIEMMFTLPKCSECGAESTDGGNYCPNCGARMDEERKEDNNG